VAHDAHVLQQAGDVGVGEAGDALEFEPMEGGTEILALGKDGSPAQARLEALEAKLLEQAPVVGHREAPFGVVVGEVLGRRRAPLAARPAIGTDECRAHVPVAPWVAEWRS
jgi:hypothetical protein